MDFQPADFAEVPYGSIAPAACAPKISDPGFLGIVIRTPQEIRGSTREALRIPICGYYQLATGPLVAGADMRIHVRSVSRGELPPLSVPVTPDADGANEPLVPPPHAGRPVDPNKYRGHVSEAYFYLDAQRYLPHTLPPGTYEVCVTYGRDQSNVARVTITRR